MDEERISVSVPFLIVDCVYTSLTEAKHRYWQLIMVGFIYNHYDFQIDAISQGTYLPSRDNLGALLVSSIDKVKSRGN